MGIRMRRRFFFFWRIASAAAEKSGAMITSLKISLMARASSSVRGRLQMMIPPKGAWTVILNKKAEQPGTANEYKADLDLLRVQIKPTAAPFRERLAFIFSNMTDDKASLDLEWEKLRLSIPIGVGTSQQALANITTATDNTWRTYANAARYMLETKKDFDAESVSSRSPRQRTPSTRASFSVSEAGTTSQRTSSRPSAAR